MEKKKKFNLTQPGGGEEDERQWGNGCGNAAW